MDIHNQIKWTTIEMKLCHLFFKVLTWKYKIAEDILGRYTTPNAFVCLIVRYSRQ